MNTIEINVPYIKRHLIVEIKNSRGKFSPENKTWVLEDNPQTRALKEMIERRITAPSQAARIKNIAALSADLLNELKYRLYKVTEAGDRITIESTPLVATAAPPVAAITHLVAAGTPPVAVGSPPVAASMPPAVDSTMVVS